MQTPVRLPSSRRAAAAGAALAAAFLAVPAAWIALAATSDPGGTVEAGPDLPADRAAAFTARLADGRIMLIGGHGDDATPLGTVEVLNPADLAAGWTSLPTQSTHDLGFVARLIDGRFLLAGGAASGGTTAHADAEVFDPATGTSTATNPCVRARRGGTAATLTGGHVLLVGAWSDEGGASHFGETWNPATGEFMTTGALFTARAWPIVVPTPDGGALVIGGLHPTAGTRVTSIETWSVALRSFAEVRNDLFVGETGWEPFPGRDALRLVEAQQIFDGRLLHAAVNPSAGGAQTLYTIDPATQAVARFTTTPALPDTTTATIHATLVSPSGEEAYVLLRDRTAAAAPAYDRFRLATVTLRTGALDDPPDTFVPAGDHLPDDGGHNVLADGRVLVAGGRDVSAPDDAHSSARTFLLTPGDPLPEIPPAPTGVTAGLTGPALVEVGWTDASLDEDGFHVEGRRTGTEDWAPLGDASRNGVTFVHDTVVAGESWEYRVASFNGGGASEWVPAAAAVTIHAGKATLPKKLAFGKVRAAVLKKKKVWISNTDRRASLAFGVTGLTGPYTILPIADMVVVPPRKKVSILVTLSAPEAGSQPGSISFWTSDPRKGTWTVTFTAKAR